ncbi:MAG: UDP-N-acetylmuramoyl-tripeptide-D-alanyl-D-alanine ligase [Parcubacteria group bacterium GW2011_GWA1_51_12]|nr:MAG: UDP-N-acetylmuramoyl-tripeptide-D-alanyl-D-alanine ligase [Parcubacteria group bacterium GW2011_GWA1_51_12]
MLYALLKYYLYGLARIILWRHKPAVIGITGSVGKTSARDAVYTVLSMRFSVWRGVGEKNYNNEIGVPLVILGARHHGRNLIGWIGVFFVFLGRLFSGSYPKLLILEMGVDHPGDMEYLTKLAPPAISLITGFGSIPVHVEFFSGPEAVIAEKGKILNALAESGTAILNADDADVLMLKEKSRASVLTYGVSGAADVRIEEFQVLFRDTNGVKIPEGVVFKIRYQGALIPVRLFGALAKTQALAAAAGFCAGLAFGMNPVAIAEALAEFKPPPGRMQILKGNRHTVIIDDTYNAAPAAMEAALEALGSLPAKRKIAVLGDMLELGSYTEEAHRRIGEMIPRSANILFTVGARSRFIEEEALRSGFPESQTRHMDDSREVESVLRPMLEPGDLVLVKGGQGMRMERVVEAIMVEPEKAHELLVRQSVDWKRKI